MKKINYSETFIKAMKKTNLFGEMCQHIPIEILRRLISKKDQWNEYEKHKGTLKQNLKDFAYQMKQVEKDDLAEKMYQTIHLVEEIEEATK